jgi:general secretion pathway protein A
MSVHPRRPERCFPRVGQVVAFFAGGAHREALARLDYLVETNRRCALLTGPRGSGKSSVLAAFAAQQPVAARPAAVIDLEGLDAGGLLARLAAELAITAGDRGGPRARWREIGDALAGRRRAGGSLFIGLDHVDETQADALVALRRLLALCRQCGGASLALAFSGPPFDASLRPWIGLADLAVELTPLAADETAAFVRCLLEQAGLRPDAFDDQAAETIHRLSGGIPRLIVRVYEMALLGALRDDCSQVGGDVVEAAVRELSLLRVSA